MPIALKSLESIKYAPGSLKLLDQRQLPLKTHFDDVETIEDIFNAIKEMRVRGAPAIAVSAALGVAVAAQRQFRLHPEKMKSTEQAQRFLIDGLDYVAKSRPTAVNLFNMIRDLKRGVENMNVFSEGEAVVAAFVKLAEEIYSNDVRCNESLMKKGAAYILEHNAQGAEKINVLTICNTGALATSKYGTALGVVRELFYEDHLDCLYACETRPWNQGARLTVYECQQENIPVTLICDSAASSLMKSHRIHAVVVGADRICHNGDTANKIGTYNLAVAARYHGVPFYVAAPSSTIDPETPSGEAVQIEERSTFEITHNMQTKERVVAEGDNIRIWNPVFDITPAELITGGIITEKGVFAPNEGASARFDVAAMI